MYISILEQQAKYDDALEILSGNLGSLIGIEADKLRLQVVLAFIASFFMMVSLFHLLFWFLPNYRSCSMARRTRNLK